LAFLDQETPAKTAERPFCLILSLANPHDVLSYPNTWDQESTDTPGCFNYKNGSGMFDMIDIPGKFSDYLNNYNDDLNTKPSVQAQSMNLYAGLGTLQLDQKKKNYFNFYAYLQKLTDAHIQEVLNRLDSRDLTESTIVIRLSDHGEMGLSHGLRQKMFNVYEESIHVPLVFSNPILFPSSTGTDAMASLVDVLPTMASLANIPDSGRYLFHGKDLSLLFKNPSLTVQDRLLYLFDDEYSGLADPPKPNYPITQPNHIRCLRLKDKDGEWKYARYFDPAGTVAEQYEMYHLFNADGTADDLDELKNLSSDKNFNAKREELARALTALESQKLASWNTNCRAHLPTLKR
jgi:choline-sulfatase